MTQKAYLASGCFWCTEAAFQKVKGVEKVISGYCNGDNENPTYEQVCSGTTNHAECVEVTFDDSQIDFATLLKIFFLTHDPTTLNRQGNDRGTQYRSGIYYISEEQKAIAEQTITKLETEKAFDSPIVTEVAPLQKFYPAEKHHQDYYNQNPQNPYCWAVISPKIAKMRKELGDYLK